MPDHSSLIRCSPFEEPTEHWAYDPATRAHTLAPGRRPAGYLAATDSGASADGGRFVPLELVNQIRPLVRRWRESEYAGATTVTRDLLQHWKNPDREEGQRLFFAQLEAIESLIWTVEGPAKDRASVTIENDGGSFQRYCAKMATGSGKTNVMALVIAWQIINKAIYPTDERFSKNIFIVAPGLTVRNRLQVLIPDSKDNVYKHFDLIPQGYGERLRQGRVLIRNWHALAWETDERVAKRKSVDKRGAKSDRAWTKEILGESNDRDWIVINDEAHHAWRTPALSELGKNARKSAAEEATIWVGALDRLQRTRGIRHCFDFSATPYAPTGRGNDSIALFPWIVSDFGLSDAIESGLVKTPRVVVRTNAAADAATLKSRFYHIYDDRDVREDLNRRAEPAEVLPSLVTQALNVLGADWQSAYRQWSSAGSPTPPVMIVVCNRTETAARIQHALTKRKIEIEDLCDPEHVLHIDSKVLADAELNETPVELAAPTASEADDAGGEDSDAAPERKLTKQQSAEWLRKRVDTVGKPGEPGANVRVVISVDMLSEGWDTKTVTHILGLRAFTSQLLCEQVIGRGLRRTSYEADAQGRFIPEYVNVFGVPFAFLPHLSEDVTKPPEPPRARYIIESRPERSRFAIRWPNVLRVDRIMRTRLSLDLQQVPVLELNSSDTVIRAELAALVDGKASMDHLTEIDFATLAREKRLQEIAFRAAGEVYDQHEKDWAGSKAVTLAQLLHHTDRFLHSDRIRITPRAMEADEGRRNAMFIMNMGRIVRHVASNLTRQSAERLQLVLHDSPALRSTFDMEPWQTLKRCDAMQKTHVNLTPVESGPEHTAAQTLDRLKSVAAWIKNDHLGFCIYYQYGGAIARYFPDFIVRLSNDAHLILEIKGRDTERDRIKRLYADDWVKAVNFAGGYGLWLFAVSFDAGDIEDKIAQALQESTDRIRLDARRGA